MLGWLLVVPIVTLYLMIDLDRIKLRMYHVIAERHRGLVVDLSMQVGRVFSAYLRGLMMVCLSFGIALYVVLGGMFQMEYAVIIALLAVVLYAVPYLGQLLLLVVCGLVAWATVHQLGYVLGVAAAVILVGQLFDQLITPRVMGKQVGLHPVLGVFALMVGGQLFGLPGMVVAVPVAASLRVVLIYLFPRLGEPIPADHAAKDLAALAETVPAGEAKEADGAAEPGQLAPVEPAHSAEKVRPE
jgi:predicted PurR-regulated permease PerM